jgi:cob(I)alamin adenosyltransferase
VSIATKTGDKGETSLMYGRRVPKDDARVEAYGRVDELNSALGLARATAKDEWVREQILTAQKELIAVMGELATAPEDVERYRKDGFALTTSAMVDRLTSVIDEIEGSGRMKFIDWVIPGSSLESAALDLARTTCRHAERRVAGLKNSNPEILRYLNRLSDLCWLLARKIEQ